MRLLFSALLLTSLTLPAQAQKTTGRKPPRASRPAAQLYDSTRVDFAHTLPDGISHKAAQQAVITYGKIGAGKPLDHADSLFLQQRDPQYLPARAELEARRRRPR